MRVQLNGQSLTAKLSDLIKSEAGLATFFDRKVNRGNIDPLAEIISRTMVAHNVNNLSDVARFEREVIAACRYRSNFLLDPTLKQPDN